MPGQQLQRMGDRLRRARLDRGDTQASFAARLGISVPTLRKMENGDPAIQIGNWAEALEILDRGRDLDAILAPEEDLFARLTDQAKPKRRRAPRRRSG